MIVIYSYIELFMISTFPVYFYFNAEFGCTLASSMKISIRTSIVQAVRNVLSIFMKKSLKNLIKSTDERGNAQLGLLVLFYFHHKFDLDIT